MHCSCKYVPCPNTRVVRDKNEMTTAYRCSIPSHICFQVPLKTYIDSSMVQYPMVHDIKKENPGVPYLLLRIRQTVLHDRNNLWQQISHLNRGRIRQVT